MGRSAAVILAAGGGTRFLGPDHKLRMPVGDGPLVLRPIRAACAAGFDEVMVVAGAIPLDDLVPDGVTLVRNPAWATGMGSSLSVAIVHAAAAGHDAVVVGLGDQPGITAEAWRRIRGAVRTPLAVATYGGRRGHPVRIAASLWPELPTTGEGGARGLLRDRPELVTEVRCDGEPGDVDTREDLERWTREP